VRGKLDWSEKLRRWCSPCQGEDGGDSLKSSGGGDSPMSGCGQEARGWWEVLAACAGGRAEGMKRSGGAEVALPFYTRAAEVGDGSVGGTSWKEEGGPVWRGRPHREGGPGSRHRPKAGGGRRCLVGMGQGRAGSLTGRPHGYCAGRCCQTRFEPTSNSNTNKIKVDRPKNYLPELKL
jgi:hypothetical protein